MAFHSIIEWRSQLPQFRIRKKVTPWSLTVSFSWKGTQGCKFVPYTSSETIRHRWYQAGSKYWWNQGLVAWFRAKSTTLRLDPPQKKDVTSSSPIIFQQRSAIEFQLAGFPSSNTRRKIKSMLVIFFRTAVTFVCLVGVVFYIFYHWINHHFSPPFGGYFWIFFQAWKSRKSKVTLPKFNGQNDILTIHHPTRWCFFSKGEDLPWVKSHPRIAIYKWAQNKIPSPSPST